MWPFSESKAAPKVVNEPSAAEVAIGELRAWRPIGGSFTYLGRECIVSGHCRTEYWAYGCSTRPLLRADYADNNGVIHEIRLSLAEAKAIMAKQP